VDRVSTFKRLHAFAMVLIACTLSPCADAQSEVDSAHIAIRAQAVAQPSPLLLKISGNWFTQCPPTMQHVTLDGDELRIEARSVLSLCARRPTAFAIEVNPALAMNRTALATGVYRVGFYAATGNQSMPTLRAFSLIQNGAPMTSVLPESGFWWNSSDLQTGTHRVALTLELQGGQLSAALLSYDDSGSPAWQFGTAPLNGRIAHVPLLKMSGGSDPFAATALAPRGEQDMTLDLEFHSGAHASAWLSRRTGTIDDPVLDLKQMDLVRLPSSNAAEATAWEGDWILTADASFIGTQRLHLRKLADIDVSHFELMDAETDIHLVCERKGGNAEQLPRNCVLRDTNGAEIGRFDALAISRMEGKRPDGFEVHLIRVSH
jgi:hypothetical protein